MYEVIDCDYIIGADEAGRGSLAGPLVAAAVAVPIIYLDEIKNAEDSKKINAKKRVSILKDAFAKVTFFSIISISPEDIDKIGIQKANKFALRIVVEDVAEKIRKINKNSRIAVIIDHYEIECNLPNVEIYIFNKADSRFKIVALASIIAKVFRDGILSAAEEFYVDYSFSRHKGYGTAEHLNEIYNFGFCSLHRKSFKPVSQGKLFI